MNGIPDRVRPAGTFSAILFGLPRFPPGRIRLRLLLLGSLLALGTAGTLAAQEEVSAVLRGEVLRSGEALTTGRVVLHRVTPGEAGEIDSVGVGPDGRFELTLPAIPDPGARSEVFFASVRHLGILYFGPPISEPVQLDSVYSIQVYDTATAPAGGAPIPVSVRNVFIEETEVGWRVTDVFQLRNDTDRTWVAAEDAPERDAGPETGPDMDPGAIPGAGAEEGMDTDAREEAVAPAQEPERPSVWSYPLPAGASNFEVGQSDLPPDAAGFDGTRIHVFAPVPPGERVYVIRYMIPDLEVDFPMPGLTEIMELLVLEPLPPLSVAGLQADQPVELEPGSTYRRYAGTNLRDGTIAVRLGEEDAGLPMAWLAVILALILGLAGIAAVKKRPDRAIAPAPATRGALLRQIALLDEAFSARPDPDPEEVAKYQARRVELKEHLRRIAR